MKKTAIFYSFNTQKTARVAKLIASKLAKANIEHVNVETTNGDEFRKYDNYILGSSTWWEGELPNHWDEFRPALEDLDLNGKTFALFGLGDQVKYPDYFGDAIGTLKAIVEQGGGRVVGSASTEGFQFDRSAAIENGRFVGAMVDEDNQPELTEARIDAWLALVKPEFK